MLLNPCMILILKRPILKRPWECRPRFAFFFRSALVLCLVSQIPPTRSAIAQETIADSQGETSHAFEVVAIKLSKPDNPGTSWNGTNDRITIENFSLRHLIRVAYGLKSDTQILEGPDALLKQKFDIAAKIEDADVARLKDTSYETRMKAVRLMLQSMLAERFQLKVNLGDRTLPVYALVVGKSGAKLTPLPAPKDKDEALHRNHSESSGNGHMVAKAITMDSFADFLTGQPDTGDRVVLNRTALAGDFDLSLNWTEDRVSGNPSDAADPGLFTALVEQLGLELRPDKGAIPVVTVVVVGKPVLD